MGGRVASWHPVTSGPGPGVMPCLGGTEAVAVVGAVLEPHKPVFPPPGSATSVLWHGQVTSLLPLHSVLNCEVEPVTLQGCAED